MRAGVESVTVTTAEEALEEFKQASGFGDALTALEDNPLPHHLVVRPKKDASGPAEVESLRRYFAAFPEVDIVQLDLDWVRRLHALLDVLRRVLWVVVSVLGLGVQAVRQWNVDGLDVTSGEQLLVAHGLCNAVRASKGLCLVSFAACDRNDFGLRRQPCARDKGGRDSRSAQDADAYWTGHVDYAGSRITTRS